MKPLSDRPKDGASKYLVQKKVGSRWLSELDLWVRFHLNFSEFLKRDRIAVRLCTRCAPAKKDTREGFGFVVAIFSCSEVHCSPDSAENTFETRWIEISGLERVPKGIHFDTCVGID